MSDGIAYYSILHEGFRKHCILEKQRFRPCGRIPLLSNNLVRNFGCTVPHIVWVPANVRSRAYRRIGIIEPIHGAVHLVLREASPMQGELHWSPPRFARWQVGRFLGFADHIAYVRIWCIYGACMGFEGDLVHRYNLTPGFR